MTADRTGVWPVLGRLATVRLVDRDLVFYGDVLGLRQPHSPPGRRRASSSLSGRPDIMGIMGIMDADDVRDAIIRAVIQASGETTATQWFADFKIVSVTRDRIVWSVSERTRNWIRDRWGGVIQAAASEALKREVVTVMLQAPEPGHLKDAFGGWSDLVHLPADELVARLDAADVPVTEELLRDLAAIRSEQLPATPLRVA